MRRQVEVGEWEAWVTVPPIVAGDKHLRSTYELAMCERGRPTSQDARPTRVWLRNHHIFRGKKKKRNDDNLSQRNTLIRKYIQVKGREGREKFLCSDRSENGPRNTFRDETRICALFTEYTLRSEENSGRFQFHQFVLISVKGLLKL